MQQIPYKLFYLFFLIVTVFMFATWKIIYRAIYLSKQFSRIRIESTINSILRSFDLIHLCTQVFSADPLAVRKLQPGVLLFFSVEKGTTTSTLKRYWNQSIIRNNGFLKTTFHRPPPGGHVVSPCTSASLSDPVQHDVEPNVLYELSELSKGCLHVASCDVLDENNSLGYGSVTLGVTEGRLAEKRRERLPVFIARERFSADKILLNIALKGAVKVSIERRTRRKVHRKILFQKKYCGIYFTHILCHKSGKDLHSWNFHHYKIFN